MKRFILVPVLFLALFEAVLLVPAAGLKRGPYLQKATPTSIVIRWRTDTPTDSRVRYGPAPDALNQIAGDPALTTEHEVEIGGLSPDTLYYYSVGSASAVLSTGAENYFVSAPADSSSVRPVRIWTFGDAGWADDNQRDVRDEFYDFIRRTQRRADLLLLLGDNAYDFGTDEEYQETFFDIYSDLLKNTPVWSTFGNHEGFSSVSAAQFGPYYDMFTFPTNGEAGGAPSGTEAYYSFDYANIHFICLNSHDIPRADFGAMMNWLRADLAQNTQQWTIAYFHHPPYSRGSHDSDNTPPLDTPESAASIREMRETALPILEQAGVDLVLTGHSHSYERSFLLDGHYGTSGTLTEEMMIDPGDGRIGGDGFYRKTSDTTADSHAGTVYAVVGSGGGDPRGGRLNHPVMIESLNLNGSLVIDVSGTRLDAQFLDKEGAVQDTFSLQKGVLYPAAPAQQPIQDDDVPDQTEGLDRDGRYRLLWTYPAPPVEQPACGYRIEEATAFGPIFADDAEELLTAGVNSRWNGDGPEWFSAVHPGTGTQGYSVVYTVEQNNSLTLKDALAIPAGHAAFLTFDSYEDIEKDYDFGFVEISTAGGEFQTLARFSGFFNGKRSVDLSAYAGQTFTVRFRFTSDFITLPPQLGWFIDNIAVETSNFSAVGTISSSVRQFDISGSGNGTYAYRLHGLFGNCAAGPVAGPASRVRQITVELGPVTALPTADFTAAPNPARVAETVAFDASGSADNDAEGSAPEIVSYFWSFGDGHAQTNTTPATSHAYTTPGIYRATLTVTDNDGETAETEQFIEINEPEFGKISGGGWITVGGEKANFGFNAKTAGGSFSGHLIFEDKANGLKVKSVDITSLVISGNRAVFSGSCTLNRASGYTFTVEVADNGEPGKDDTFRIRLSNGYEAAGTLSGGNIKFH